MAKSTQLVDILKFVFMSERYLSDLALKIAVQHPAVMLEVQSSFPLKDTTLSEVWGASRGCGRKQ